MVVMAVIMRVAVRGLGARGEFEWAVRRLAVGADPFHVMVVAFLHRAHFGLEAQHLGAVLAELAVHGDVAGDDLFEALDECVDHRRMIVEIGCLDEFDFGMARRHRIGGIIDAVDENAGEEEIGEHHDALETEAHAMLESGLDQREGDAGIGDLAPAEAEAFPQHAHDLRDVRVRIRVRGAATHHHKQCLVARDVIARGLQRLLDAVTGGAQHLGVDAQFLAVVDGDAVLRSIGVQH